MIYLDNAASTKVHDRVLESMLPYLQEQYGNASSIHRYGRKARKAVEGARKKVASLMGADPSEIMFTSGGTESNNTALCGVARAAGTCGHVITSAIEHEAVLEPCRSLAREGFEVDYLPVDARGMVDPALLADRISENTRIVSVMLGNNEVGTVQRIREIGEICRKHGVVLHTDAVQAAGKIPIDVGSLGADLVSISSHKLHGPKGAGALYIRDGVRIDPIILGGGQERGLRSGTEGVANIVGFGEACAIAHENLAENAARMKKLRDMLVDGVLGEIPKTALNGDPESRLPNNAHFTFLGIEGEDLIIKLDEYGVAASTGSACSVNTQKASHVLQAMGLSRDQIAGSLRLTTSVLNSEEEVDKAIGLLKKAVAELRAVSPFKEKYSF